jgi:hypothetical protein
MVSAIKQTQSRDHKETNTPKPNSQPPKTEQNKTDKKENRTINKKTVQPFSHKKHWDKHLEKHLEKEPLRQEEHWKNQQGRTGETIPLDNTNPLGGTKTKKEKKVRNFPFRKIHEIEEEIFARETQIMAWNEDLLRPEIARDGERTKTIHLEIKAEQDKIALLYEHWEEANELNW